MYVKTIPCQVMIYMVNVNEKIERLRESRNHLKALLSEPHLADVTLLLLLNKRTENVSKENQEYWQETPFNKD